jgi:hypothetical protein
VLPYFSDWARRTKSALVLYRNTALAAGVRTDDLKAIREKHGLAWPAWP